MNWITDNIALGSCMDIYTLKGVDFILNMAAEVPPVYNGIPILHLKIYDGNTIENSILDEALNYIAKADRLNKKIFVHCIAGISRSPSIVASYLALRDNISFEDAMKLVQTKRPVVDPNYSSRVFNSCKNYVERKQR
jgi:protein-tyrosine phosphatase